MFSKNITISLSIVLLMACSPKEETVNSELNIKTDLNETLNRADELALDMLEKKQAKINEQTLISTIQENSLKYEENLLSDAKNHQKNLENELFETQKLQQLAVEQALIESAKVRVQALDEG